MCGLFGAIGLDINYGTVRALAIANRLRGTDGLGFFDSNGTIAKAAGDPIDVLSLDDEIIALLRPADRWYIAGHTRWSTRGKDTDENCHPFTYGKVIGSHNGCIWAPNQYTVDSEFAFDLLNACDNNYQTALGDVGGSFALTWSYDGKLYMLPHRNPLAVAVVGETVYYSSDLGHLAACVDSEDMFRLDPDSVLEFELRDGRPRLTRLPEFKETVKSYMGFQSANGVAKDGTSVVVADAAGVEQGAWPDGESLEGTGELFDVVTEDVDPDGDEWASSDRVISSIEEYDAKAKGLGYLDLDDLMDNYGLVTLDMAINFIDDTEAFNRRLDRLCHDSNRNE